MPADYLSRDEFHTTLTLRFLEFRKEFQHFVARQFEAHRIENREYVDEQIKKTSIYFTEQIKKTNDYFAEQIKKTNEYFAEQRIEMKKLVEEQRSEFEGYTGSLKEYFMDGVDAISEGVRSCIEKTDRLERLSNEEFSKLDVRLARFEMTKARRRIKTVAKENKQKRRGKKGAGN